MAPGWSLVSVEHYKTYGLVGDAALYVFRVGGSSEVLATDRVAPASTSTPKQQVGRWKPVIGAVAVVATALLSLRRTQGFGATDTIWAEDGRQFFQGTVRHNFFDLLFTPYNGYLHFVPRVLIEIVRIFPLEWAAEVIATIGALVTSACAALIYRASRRHLRSPALRIAVAVPVALPYVGQLEDANNLAGLHLLLLYVAFWMAIWNPVHRRLQILAAVMLFCTVASDPLAALFLPLVLLRWWTIRGWRGGLPVIAMGVGLAYQAVGVVFRGALQSRHLAPPHYDPVWAFQQYLQTVTGQGLFTDQENERFGLLVRDGNAHYVAWILAGAALVVALLRVTQPNWPLVVVALVHSLLLFCGLAMQGGSAAPRYELPAICLLLVAVAGLLTPRKDTAMVSPRLLPAYAVLGLVVLCVIGGYPRYSQWRGSGPSFSSQLAKASTACNTTGVHDTVISVAPAFASWEVTVPCDLVRARDDFFQLSRR